MAASATDSLSTAWTEKSRSPQRARAIPELSERQRRRFAQRYRVNATTGCWEWTGNIKSNGYGRFPIGQHGFYAHRVSYALHVGPLDLALTLDHLCRNRICVNPDHLEQVTQGENVLRGVSPCAQNALQTHCRRGHEFTPENTAIKRDRRICRACDRETHRRASAVRRARLRNAASGLLAGAVLIGLPTGWLHGIAVAVIVAFGGGR